MKTQSDNRKRVVSLVNLVAMCDRISGTCHTFNVSRVTRSRVHVEYSNPNEYGTPNPITAVYPCYPSTAARDDDNPLVVMDMMRCLNDGDGEGWQSFIQLEDCEQLCRDPSTMLWESEYEIRVKHLPQFTVTSTWDKDGCIQTWFTKDRQGNTRSFPSWRQAQDFAVSEMKAAEQG